MNNIFYLLPILFIFNTIFYLKNRLYLDSRADEKDLNDVRLSEGLYYLIVLIYFFWCLFGIILTDDITFIILSSIWFTKFIIFHINKKAYMVYNYLYPYMQIIFMLYILYTKFLQMMLGYDNKLITFFITPLNHSFPLISIFLSHFQIIFKPLNLF